MYPLLTGLFGGMLISFFLIAFGIWLIIRSDDTQARRKFIANYATEHGLTFKAARDEIYKS